MRDENCVNQKTCYLNVTEPIRRGREENLNIPLILMRIYIKNLI